MLTFIAKRWAKVRYRFNQLTEAETNLLNAGLALRQSLEKRDLIARLTKEADEMDARIKEVEEKLDKGFWECEDGHESPLQFERGSIVDTLTSTCQCGKPAKLIQRDHMTGQEKYESDKERKEAEDLVKSKRDQAAAEEENAANSEKTAKYFQQLAQSNRNVAERVRRL